MGLINFTKTFFLAKKEYKWNPVYKLVMKIKGKYIRKFGMDELTFEEWLEKLNDEKLNKIFEPIQLTQYKNYLLVRYGIAASAPGFWANPKSLYRECRSIVIDLKNDTIVLSPLKKFFNLNEYSIEENKMENIEKELSSADYIEFPNKLDGSMQSARWYNNEIVMSGAKALDPKCSWRLEHGLSMLTDNYKKMLKENPDLTFIFEYISLKDAHIVIYTKEQEGLYLIGIRNVYTGKEMNYAEIITIAEKYGVKHVELENLKFCELLKLTEKYKSNEKEGWVVNIVTNGIGHRMKVKCSDYSQLHKLLDKISSINVVIQAIAEDTFDDLLSKIPDAYKERIVQIAKMIYDYRTKTIEEANHYYELAPKNDTKTFMIWCTNNVPKNVLSYVRNIYRNQDFNVLKSSSGYYKKLSDMGITGNYSAIFTDGNTKEEEE